MTLLADVLIWLAQPQRWQGSDSIPVRVAEHVLMSATALVIAAAIALPVGLALGHSGKGGLVAINLANIGRALPSLALLALALPLAFALGLGLGFWPTMFALIPLGIPPMLTNSYVAIREVPRETVEVARGLGMREWQVLTAAEIPMAAPVIIAGIRNSAVAIVATATLGAIVASGGLGRYIVDGLARQEEARLFIGALLVALLAMATEVAFELLERLLVSPGIRAAGLGENRSSGGR
jgi:osmoprotectant transport system permease protein